MIWHDIKKIYRSFRFAAHGLMHAYKNDRSFALEVNWGFPIYLLLGFLFAPMSFAECSLLVGSYLLILIVELINTAYETMLARLHPEHHELIGAGKDISAAAVALAFMFAAFVVVMLLAERIGLL
jgi:diacylglycerol kinase (ATP)